MSPLEELFTSIFDMEDRFDHRMRQDVAFSLKYRPAHEVRMTEGAALKDRRNRYSIGEFPAWTGY